MQINLWQAYPESAEASILPIFRFLVNWFSSMPHRKKVRTCFISISMWTSWVSILNWCTYNVQLLVWRVTLLVFTVLFFGILWYSWSLLCTIGRSIFLVVVVKFSFVLANSFIHLISLSLWTTLFLHEFIERRVSMAWPSLSLAIRRIFASMSACSFPSIFICPSTNTTERLDCGRCCWSSSFVQDM